jgi:chromosome partitioning protein
MRDFGVKAKLAQDFVGYIGTPSSFRQSFQIEEGAQSERYLHRLYRPDEIRNQRLTLLGYSAKIERPKDLPPIINCRMTKGGTGKTTIAANIATALSARGHRILMIDGDPQASLTSLFGIDWSIEDVTHIGELMLRNYKGREVHIREAVRPIFAGGMLDLIASDISLASADSWLLSATGREKMLKRLFDAQLEFFSQYDAIIIDSPPGLTPLANTLMLPCKTILAITELDGYSMKAMHVLDMNVKEINSAFDDVNIDVLVVANKYRHGIKSREDALQQLGLAYGDKIYEYPLPEAESFKKQMSSTSADKSGTVLEREPNSVAAKEIIKLATWLVRFYDIKISGISTIPTKARASV